MITYAVVKGAPGYGYHVVVKESGVVVAGPFTSREAAEAHIEGRPVNWSRP